MTEETASRMSTGRIEAFSDGVIAVAITLLVLDLRVPEIGDGGLGRALVALWPNYLAYAISFLAVGIIWINHHSMLHRLALVDHSVLVLNLFLLMCIAVLPFSTSLMATYLDQPRGGHLAAAVYAGSFLLTSSVFWALQHHLLRRRGHLLREPLSREAGRAVLRRGVMAPPLYLLAGLLGLISPYLTLAVCILLGLYYLLVPARSATAVPRLGPPRRP